MADVPDCVFPSSNIWGIPDLLPSLQPIGLELPANRWGTVARKSRLEGQTVHFYTDDYRFNGLWEHPEKLIETGCNAAVEPNFSTNGEMPKAVALWHVYRKRWMARYWQAHGIEIWVDLAMSEYHRDIALMGVPPGWKAYATYTYTKDYDDQWLFDQYNMAIEHAGTKDILFWVYGGEDHVKGLCQAQGWLWTPAHQQAYLRGGSAMARKVRAPKLPRQLDKEEMPLRIEEVM